VTRSSLSFAVLGDSIGYGTGARRADETLGGRLSAALAGAGFEVALSVLAVPGAVSADLARQVRRAEALTLDLALVVVGANDLARFVPPADAAASLGAAVERLRAAGSDVVAVPAPDMSAVPFIPPALRPIVQSASALLQHRQAAAVRAAGGVVAPVSTEVARAFGSDAALFSPDRFHPSSAGYARIAAALEPHVLAAARARRDAAA
jgi:lysophospholipase L1-like esterase